MTFGERLLAYRNAVNLSQEKLAEKVGVTRQTVSKWETNQSVPDFDKILPLCEALGITTEELITGEEEKNVEIEEIKQEKERAKKEYVQKRNKKKAIVLSISIFLYCIATFALPYMIEVLRYEDAHAVMIWATLCTIATVIIVYFFVALSLSKDWVISGVVHAIVFVFTYKSQSLFYNALFLLFGYNFYYIHDQEGMKVFVISKKKDIRSCENLSFSRVRKVNDFTFIDEER